MNIYWNSYYVLSTSVSEVLYQLIEEGWVSIQREYLKVSKKKMCLTVV